MLRRVLQINSGCFLQPYVRACPHAALSTSNIIKRTTPQRISNIYEGIDNNFILKTEGSTMNNLKYFIYQSWLLPPVSLGIYVLPPDLIGDSDPLMVSIALMMFTAFELLVCCSVLGRLEFDENRSLTISHLNPAGNRTVKTVDKDNLKSCHLNCNRSIAVFGYRAYCIQWSKIKMHEPNLEKFQSCLNRENTSRAFVVGMAPIFLLFLSICFPLTYYSTKALGLENEVLFKENATDGEGDNRLENA